MRARGHTDNSRRFVHFVINSQGSEGSSRPRYLASAATVGSFATNVMIRITVVRRNLTATHDGTLLALKYACVLQKRCGAAAPFSVGQHSQELHF